MQCKKQPPLFSCFNFFIISQKIKSLEAGCTVVSLETDLVSVLFLTSLLVIVMISSSANRKTLISPATEYLWIIALPSLATWLGWIAIAFIIDRNKYLLVKGKLRHCIINKNYITS